jgi:predicted nucleic acid-binding Zn ribbon protein
MIEQHKHCPVCGTPMPMSERFCSPNCEQLALANQQKVKKSRRLLYGLFAVFILVWLFFMLKGKIGF